MWLAELPPMIASWVEQRAVEVGTCRAEQAAPASPGHSDSLNQCMIFGCFLETYRPCSFRTSTVITGLFSKLFACDFSLIAVVVEVPAFTLRHVLKKTPHSPTPNPTFFFGVAVVLLHGHRVPTAHLKRHSKELILHLVT